MDGLQKHTASGQALGYFFQLERAMSWLAKSPIGSVVGIETEDDVVVKLLNGESIYEQDKSSTSSTFPFSINRKDFWNTLNIWLSGLSSGEIRKNLEHSFYMVTNKIGNTNDLVSRIGKATDKDIIKELVNEIRLAGNTTPEGIQDLVNKVLGYNDKQLSYLIEKIHYVDGSSSTNKQQLVSDLQIPEDDPL